jgi:hypothetical protein
MSRPIKLLPERRAVLDAIRGLESGRPEVALDILRRALSHRKPPKGPRDHRSEGIVRLRAHIEKAIVELEHDEPAAALKTLRLGLAPPPGSHKRLPAYRQGAPYSLLRCRLLYGPADRPMATLKRCPPEPSMAHWGSQKGSIGTSHVIDSMR